MTKKPAGRTTSLWLLMPTILMLWASFAAVSKLTLGSMDSFQLQFWMFGAAALGMTVTLAARGKLRTALQLQRGQWIPAVLCGLTHYLYYFLYTLSLRMIPAVEASMLNDLFPVMVVLFAIPINGDRLTPVNAASVALGFVGTLVVLTGGRLTGFRFSNIVGDLLALGAAVAWGVYSNIGRRAGSDVEASVWQTAVISFALSVVSLFLFSGFRTPTLLSLAGAVWLGVSNIWLSLPLWLKALKTAPTVLVAGITFITPFVSLLLIVLLTGESISPGQIAGLLIISGSILMQSVRFPQRRGREAAGTQAPRQ